MTEQLWNPGDLVVERHVFRGVVHWGAPMWLVEDSGTHVATYLPVGTMFQTMGDEDGNHTREYHRATRRVFLPWRDHHALHLTRAGDDYNVTLFWTEDWRFRCWYVNFQEPMRRYEHGFDTMDQTLDLIIGPDREWHRWKDEDEFQWGIDAGWYTTARLAELKAIGAGVIEDARRGAWPFGERWEEWRPDIGWGCRSFRKDGTDWRETGARGSRSPPRPPHARLTRLPAGPLRPPPRLEPRMTYEQISVDVADRILTITLERPERLNAFTERMKDEMIDAFDRADGDDDVRAVIVTGRGRGFCAGADLSRGPDTFANRAETIDAHRDGGGLLTLRIFESKKPVIAAINGPAVGVGVTMTLPMDIRLASENARFGFVFARRGLVPEAASTWFLPRVVGINRAAEWVYTGRVLPASEALDAGLVRSVHAPGDLLPAARAIAREIAENTSAVSVALSRQMMWKLLGADHPMEAHKLDSRAIFTLGKTADAREGVASFLEKRAPEFPNRVSSDMPGWFPWWEERTFS